MEIFILPVEANYYCDSCYPILVLNYHEIINWHLDAYLGILHPNDKGKRQPCQYCILCFEYVPVWVCLYKMLAWHVILIVNLNL